MQSSDYGYLGDVYNWAALKDNVLSTPNRTLLSDKPLCPSSIEDYQPCSATPSASKPGTGQRHNLRRSGCAICVQVAPPITLGVPPSQKLIVWQLGLRTSSRMANTWRCFVEIGRIGSWLTWASSTLVTSRCPCLPLTRKRLPSTSLTSLTRKYFSSARPRTGRRLRQSSRRGA